MVNKDYRVTVVSFLEMTPETGAWNKIIVLLIIIIKTQPPIKLLHSINQYCVMNNKVFFAMNEMDLKFNKIIICFFSEANFRNPTML